MFELGRDLFDRVQVGRAFWQEDDLALVATAIVHDNVQSATHPANCIKSESEPNLNAD